MKSNKCNLFFKGQQCILKYQANKKLRLQHNYFDRFKHIKINNSGDSIVIKSTNGETKLYPKRI